MSDALRESGDALLRTVACFFVMFADASSPSDLLRRQKIPARLYRYLAGKEQSFGKSYSTVRKGGRMAWVVGVNQTTLGGVPIVIDAPGLLSRLADDAGFKIEEPIRLQAYHRYGVHQKNAIREESILLFRR